MPAASEPAPGGAGGLALPVRFRPFGVRVAAVGFSLLLLATLVVVWLSLPEHVRLGFSWFQWLTVVAMTVGTLVVAHALGRCRVDADDDGVSIVNGYRTHRFVWGQLVAVTLRPGNPWAVVDLSNGTTCSAMGIQGSDGARARAQTRQLRALIEGHAATDPRDSRP
jgi:hypothetical protein